jgi:hypothetical protein
MLWFWRFYEIEEFNSHSVKDIKKIIIFLKGYREELCMYYSALGDALVVVFL